MSGSEEPRHIAYLEDCAKQGPETTLMEIETIGIDPNKDPTDFIIEWLFKFYLEWLAEEFAKNIPNSVRISSNRHFPQGLITAALGNVRSHLLPAYFGDPAAAELGDTFVRNHSIREAKY